MFLYILPSVNRTGNRALVDTKVPEIKSFALLSSNLGTNSDYNSENSKSLLLHDNDTVSLKFVTSERISTFNDLGGVKKPEMFFILGQKNLKVENENIQINDNDTSGTKWVAQYQINEIGDNISKIEDYLGFKLKIFDKPGNERPIIFSDNGTHLIQTEPQNAVIPTSNTSGDRVRVDTLPPEIKAIALGSSNTGENKDRYRR